MILLLIKSLFSTQQNYYGMVKSRFIWTIMYSLIQIVICLKEILYHPYLANMTLHDMEDALRIKFNHHCRKNGSYAYYNRSKYVMVCYADDFVIEK